MNSHEPIAVRLFTTAIKEERAWELLEALFNGATATVGPDGKMVIISADMIRQTIEDS